MEAQKGLQFIEEVLDVQHALLKKLEWCDVSLGYPVCPECSNIKSYGHAPGCEMDRLVNGA